MPTIKVQIWIPGKSEKFDVRSRSEEVPADPERLDMLTPLVGMYRWRTFEPRPYSARWEQVSQERSTYFRRDS